MVPDPRLRLGALHGARPRLFAFGNVAVGFIAIGNVAVGVVAIGATVAVGPIAIGINAVGILLGLGLNAVGTAALAAVNGLGVFTFAGVNGLGAKAFAYVNVGESAVVALLVGALQVAAALRVKPPAPPAPEEAPATVPLAEITSGARDAGLVRAQLVAFTEAGVRIQEDTSQGLNAELVLAGPGRVSLAEAERVPDSPAMLVTVRASREALPQAVEVDYRSAPQVSRVLWAEHFEALPAPLPFWARAGVVHRAARASLFAGAAVSLVELVRQMLG